MDVITPDPPIVVTLYYHRRSLEGRPAGSRALNTAYFTTAASNSSTMQRGTSLTLVNKMSTLHTDLPNMGTHALLSLGSLFSAIPYPI